MPASCLGPSPADEIQCIDLAIGIELLICLEAFHRIHRIIAPLAIHLTFEVTAVGERLLDLLITFRIRMKLVTGRHRALGPGASVNSLAGL